MNLYLILEGKKYVFKNLKRKNSIYAKATCQLSYDKQSIIVHIDNITNRLKLHFKHKNSVIDCFLQVRCSNSKDTGTGHNLYFRSTVSRKQRRIKGNYWKRCCYSNYYRINNVNSLTNMTFNISKLYTLIGDQARMWRIENKSHIELRFAIATYGNNRYLKTHSNIINITPDW